MRVLEKEQLKGILAALFASPEPLEIEQMAQKLEIPLQELSRFLFDLEEVEIRKEPHAHDQNTGGRSHCVPMRNMNR